MRSLPSRLGLGLALAAAPLLGAAAQEFCIPPVLQARPAVAPDFTRQPVAPACLRMRDARGRANCEQRDLRKFERDLRAYRMELRAYVQAAEAFQDATRDLVDRTKAYVQCEQRRLARLRNPNARRRDPIAGTSTLRYRPVVPKP